MFERKRRPKKLVQAASLLLDESLEGGAPAVDERIRPLRGLRALVRVAGREQ